MPVTFESLHFRNAFTYQTCDVPLSDQGFVFLQGRNGHGKSTPWEVLQHVLYGSTSRGLKRDEIISTTSTDDTPGYFAQVVLRNPEGRWRITQYRGGKDGAGIKVHKDVDGQWRLSWDGGGCPKRAPDAQKFAASLVGLTLPEYAGCLYLSQAAVHTLIEGAPAEKMLYVSRLFGVDWIDDVIKTFAETAKSLDHDLQDVEGFEHRLHVLREQRAQVLTTPVDMDGVSAQVDTHLKRLQDHHDRARNRVEQLRERDTLTAEHDTITVDHEHLRDLKGLREEHDAAIQANAIAKRRADIEKRLAQIPDTPTDGLDTVLHKLHKRLRDAENNLEGQRSRVKLTRSLEALGRVDKGSVAQLQKALEAEAVAKADLAASREALKSAKENRRTYDTGTCPTCGADMDVDAMDRLITQAREDVSSSQGVVSACAVEVSRLRPLVDLYMRAEELRREIGRLPEGTPEPEIVRDLEGRVARIQETLRVGAERAALSVELARLPTGEHRDLDVIDAEIELAEAAWDRDACRAALAKKIEAIPLGDLGAAQADWARVQRAGEEFETAYVAFQQYRGVAQSEASRAVGLDEHIAELVQELDEYRELRHRREVLRHAITTLKLLKRRRLHEVVRAIRDVLPRFTATMFSHEPDTRFRVDDDGESLDFVACRVVHGETSRIAVKGLSGGEKQRLSVALVFTLHGLLEPRKRPDLLILDEVDKGLDDVGVASLMSLVREVKDEYGTVVMTSHRPEIAGAKFDATWGVVKADEVSTLSC